MSNAIPIAYEDLNPSVLVKIFKLADLLALTPAKATQIYLHSRSPHLPVPKEGTPADRTAFEGLPPEAEGNHPV